MNVLTRKEATEYIRAHNIVITDTTLQTFAAKERGPKYHYSGRDCYYAKDDLDTWIRVEAPKMRPNRRRSNNIPNIRNIAAE